jgi:hypothetical protein
MYLVPLKTLLTEAIKRTFDADYVNRDFRQIHASVEFPMEKQNYPGIWVDFSPIGNLQTVGIGHIEYADPSDTQHSRRFTRWRFQGEASFTCVALSSLERDRLYDELIRVMAFGTESSQTSEFRSYIENNEFLAVNFDFDEISSGGFANTLGTPWMTDEMVYEASVSMECFGEFLSDGQSMTLAPLNALQIIPIGPEDTDPTDDEGWM